MTLSDNPPVGAPPNQPSHGRGRWFDPSSVNGREPLWLLGFLGQPPSVVPVPCVSRPQYVHIGWAPGRPGGVGGVAVDAFAGVSVDVEDGLDAGVSKSGGDDDWVGTLGDEEGDVAVAQVREPHGSADRVCDGGEPEAATERVAADGSAFGSGEDQAVGSGRVTTRARYLGSTVSASSVISSGERNRFSVSSILGRRRRWRSSHLVA